MTPAAQAIPGIARKIASRMTRICRTPEMTLNTRSTRKIRWAENMPQSDTREMATTQKSKTFHQSLDERLEETALDKCFRRAERQVFHDQVIARGHGNPPGFYIISAEISRLPLDGTGLRAVYSAHSSGNWG